MAKRAKKVRTYEQFDEAIKAAYKLGQLDGAGDMREKLTIMLTTNKDLWQQLFEEHKREEGIVLSQSFVRGILTSLRKSKDTGRFFHLLRDYTRQTGLEYKPKKSHSPPESE